MEKFPPNSKINVDSAMLLSWVSRIAADMVSGKNLDQVIKEILRRLRQVTNSDMAYVSLNTETETFISYSTGVKTKAYRDIRMPLGSGVLGKAALGKTVVSTNNYLEDPQIEHLPQIDQRVRAEGVKSILGMPMTLNGYVHGALLLADRRERIYDERTLNILTTVALHTSVVLANAQRIAQVEAAHARLHATHESNFFEILVKEGRIGDAHEIEDVQFRISPTAACFLAVLASPHSHAAKLRTALIHQIEQLPYLQRDVLVLTRGTQVWILGHSKNREHLLNLVEGLSRNQNLQINCGVSGDFTEPQAAPSAHRSASRALDILNLLGAAGKVLAGDSLGALGYLVEAVMRDPSAPDLLAPIQPLTTYDQTQHADLTRTAWVLAEHAFHITTAAQKLFVHENTVRQRLARISEIMGTNWRDPERLLDIHVALRAWALVNL